MGLSRNLSLILGGATACTFMVASFLPLWRHDLGRIWRDGDDIPLPDLYWHRILAHCSFYPSFSAPLPLIRSTPYSLGFTPQRSPRRAFARAGAAIGAFFQWMCTFAVVEMTPPAIANIGWRVFIVFAVLNALWIPLIYAFFPETKGLELEDVDHIFEKGGITGGVWSAPGGRTVIRHRARRHVEVMEVDVAEKN
ncbi:hypothetical protein EWM64_g9775 [Hericium alpestre]|uniref:Major facilitator superfamily (MFS) profile domain-containing protein n=1 Tax=Hericium alpestre TaxID=135208 RepID=A0A4Y9ZJM5_9AGAM|nr:hypothetical protein EWM64_g9775 [Hericium alpestre]